MKKLYPVIHVKNETQTLENVEKCFEAKVDGIFLISHGHLKYKELIELAQKVKGKYPKLWIGLNFLDVDVKIPLNYFTSDMNEYIQAIWFDDSKRGVDEVEADKITQTWKNSKFKGELFGGVAFKYCIQPKDIEKAAFEAIGNMSVVTTSGDGTGLAADIGKIQKIHKGMQGNGVLGIASGVDIENVDTYLPFVDYFLVSTGISLDYHNLDFEKLLILNSKIKTYEGS